MQSDAASDISNGSGVPTTEQERSPRRREHPLTKALHDIENQEYRKNVESVDTSHTEDEAGSHPRDPTNTAVTDLSDYIGAVRLPLRMDPMQQEVDSV